MKQQVNLFLPEFQTKKDWLNFTAMLQLSVGLILLLILVSAFQYWQISSRQGELEQLTAEKNGKRNELNVLTARLGANAADQALADSVEELEVELEEKQLLIDFLEGRSLGNTNGFSEYLADLSRYHINGLSITEVQLENSGEAVTISGYVTEADNVPVFLQSLRQGASFTGKNFETLQIGQNLSGGEEAIKPGLLQFSVSTLGDVP